MRTGSAHSSALLVSKRTGANWLLLPKATMIMYDATATEDTIDSLETNRDVFYQTTLCAVGQAELWMVQDHVCRTSALKLLMFPASSETYGDLYEAFCKQVCAVDGMTYKVSWASRS